MPNTNNNGRPEGRPSLQPDKTLPSRRRRHCLRWLRLRLCLRLLEHGADFVEEMLHVAARVDVSIDIRMPGAVGVQYQNFCRSLRLLCHIRKMMAVIAAERLPQHHQVK